MRKLTTKDWVVLSLALTVSFYQASTEYAEHNRVKELESTLSSSQKTIVYLQDELDNMQKQVISYMDSDSAMRHDLLYLQSRDSRYYDLSDLKVLTYTGSNHSRIAYSLNEWPVRNLSEYDYLFEDTPCGKVVSGYEFEYMDPAIESASSGGWPLSYNRVIYCGDGGNDGYTGVCFIADGVVVYRTVSRYGEEVSEYSYINDKISLESLASVLGIEEEGVKFNANELKVIEDSLNGESVLKLTDK